MDGLGEYAIMGAWITSGPLGIYMPHGMPPVAPFLVCR